jgi:hypothetical protein
MSLSNATRLSYVHAFGSEEVADELADLIDSGVALGTLVPGIDATAAEMNVLAGVTAGTAAASKALVVDSDKSIGGLYVVNASGIAPATAAGLGICGSGEKLGFHGVTPVTQQAVADDANVATVVAALKLLGLFT